MRMLVGGVVVLLWGWRTGRFASFQLLPGEWRPLPVIVSGPLLAERTIHLTRAVHSVDPIKLLLAHTPTRPTLRLASPSPISPS
jgi:hypothetical protein